MTFHLDSSPIVAVEWALLQGNRPRPAGCNARLGEHGRVVQVPLARLASADGGSGFGFCRATPDEARQVLGMPIAELFDVETGARGPGKHVDFPLWDLVARRADQPAYRLAAQMAGRPVSDPLRVPCYDTSLYFDDLHLADHDQAAALLVDEALEGQGRGHANFKIKVGRGARHMEMAPGTERDIAIVRAVRAALGPDAALMIDANNGFNLNLAKRVLAETADCRLFWLEEAFHEDPVLYRDLKEWMADRGLSVRIADGEGDAASGLLNWAEQGVVDVVQYDIFAYGFTAWLSLGRQLDAWGAASAPHHYGRHLGNYVSAHLAAAIEGFTFVEWDEAEMPHVDGSAYAIRAGEVHVPEAPGFGLDLDEEGFRRAVAENGYFLSL